MKISHLKLEDFRGFTGNYEFDLDANVIILQGSNGLGKTCFLDGILWSLTGEIPRLGEDKNIVSAYSSTGEARVELTLQGKQNKEYKIKRVFDGEKTKIRFETTSQGSSTGIQAEANLLEKIWPEALSTQNEQQALLKAITHSVYMQQDLIRKFIDSDENDRFEAISELLGVGRVADFQDELSNAKSKWTEITNKLKKEEKDPAKNELDKLEEKINDIEEDETKNIEDIDWEDWWEKCISLDIDIEEYPSIKSDNASSKLDKTINLLMTKKNNLVRKKEEAENLCEDIKSKETEEIDDISELKNEIKEKKEALDDKESKLKEIRKEVRKEKEQKQDLATLATIALRHLGDRCPVCDQDYDEEKTKNRLEKLKKYSNKKDLPDDEEKNKLEEDIDELKETIDSLNDKCIEAKKTKKEHKKWKKSRNEKLKKFDIDPEEEDIKNKLDEKIKDIENRISSISTLKDKGEELAVSLSTIGQKARLEEFKKKKKELEQKVDNIDSKIKKREKAGKLAQRIIEQLRKASSEIVKNKLDDISPLLNRIYSRIDPHKSFRFANLIYGMRYGKGEIYPEVSDPKEEVDSSDPVNLLSSSQINSLALSIFLAFNLGISSLPLNAVILDDPIQSLDSLNLLGVVDLLRRIKTKKQLFVSTHDSQFGDLLQRKLRPVDEGDRSIVLSFEDWNRKGPTINRSEVKLEDTYVITA
jgi:DNA repair exonuclease SbcCD ATPase subunit